MYKEAHRWIAIGLSSLLSLIFGFTLVTILIISFVSSIIGVLPDYDQKIRFMKHRGFSHTFTFVFIVTIPLTFLLIYAFSVINLILDKEIVNSGVIITKNYIRLSIVDSFISGDLISVLTDSTLLIFLVLFLSMSTHIILDIITPSGIDLFGKHINGGILSNDPITNKTLTFFGILIFIISISIAIISPLIEISDLGLFVLLFFLILIIFLIYISIRKKNRRWLENIKCYTLKNGGFCTITKKNCVIVKGTQICFTEKNKEKE